MSINKQQILDEIQRTAEINNSTPLGVERFCKETGIKPSDWYGKYWTRWGDALKEAGFEPNKMQSSYEENFLIDKFIDLMRNLGRFPVRGDILMRARNDPDFPSHNTFSRFGSKMEFATRLVEYCKDKEEFEDVIDICVPFAKQEASESEVAPHAEDETKSGFVYLLKAGRHFKIGRSNAFGRRERELAIQLPEKAITVHVISTDDAIGIEAYWHGRFKHRRANGEWFELSAAQVNAFKRRKFM